jgi:carbon starvation protein CstA
VTLPLLLLFAAAAADIYTSYRLFKRGGVELNPLVTKLFGKRPGLAPMIAVKVFACATLACLDYTPVTLMGAAVWAVVAIRNHRIP